ncbi:MAG: acyclic terpene utilization AtuA family protein [Acidimicrobiales bacterium]
MSDVNGTSDPTRPAGTTAPIRIANCSGFYGDRVSAATEMVEGGPIDVLTGDWLAELTMLILSRTRAKRPGGGYARTFVTQMEQVMGSCLDQGIKVVSNAGGLDPDGCADAVAEVADKLGLSPRIAFVHGDNLVGRLGELDGAGISLTHFDTGQPIGDVDRFITANAYLGCWGIVDALNQGADIVITGRVTDAAVTCGPAAWHHGWARNDWDALAGAVVAGHVIECGAQTTGGNYSFFTEVPGLDRAGFPWAEVAADGSCVIGKHEGTGGEVSVGTVTSQLLYEIGGPRYLGPDVTARFDTIQLEQQEQDRVRVFGVRGERPPATLKVAMNEVGGYRNDLSIALTGLDIDAKAELVQDALWRNYPYDRDELGSVTTTVIRTDHDDPDTNETATAVLRITVKDSDENKVGRRFSNSLTETALASIPGMYGLGGGPSAATAYGVYTPGLIDADLVPALVSLVGGRTTTVDSVAPADEPGEIAAAAGPTARVPRGSTRRAPLGLVVGTRSGDKGGNANLGVFARSDEAWAWLDHTLTTERLRELLPEAAALPIDRYAYPAIRSLNFLIHGLLQEGVAASTRQDGQAKSLGEWLRARVVDIPEALL